MTGRALASAGALLVNLQSQHSRSTAAPRDERAWPCETRDRKPASTLSCGAAPLSVASEFSPLYGQNTPNSDRHDIAVLVGYYE
jgi:hypothetical protein